MTEFLSFAFPNVILWLVLLAGLAARVFGTRKGRASLRGGAILILGLFSIPWFPATIGTFWSPPRVSVERDISANAAVLVLSGGRHLMENGVAWPSEASLRRGMVGISIAQETNLPLVISGGRLSWDFGPSEAALVASSINAPAATILDESATNTWETALFMRDEVARQGWEGVVLVSDPLHLRRARAAMTAVGVPVLGTAAPVPLSLPGTSYRAFVPSFKAFRSWHTVVYEMTASTLYVLRGRIGLKALFP